ncbi:MAG TPA: NADH-ubiquinone oxidoreductase-F iron-sulfur binding region domain-containing protein, partial [Chloroflexota bacterium]
KSEVFGIASSFPDFVLEPPPPEGVTRVCAGAACRQARRRAGTPADSGAPRAAVGQADCLFICGVAPALEVDGRLVGRDGLRSPLVDVSAATLVQDGSCSRAVADTLSRTGGTHVGCAGNCWQAPAVSNDGGATWTSPDGATWQRPRGARLLADVGRLDPLAPRAYAALERALSLGSANVWNLVQQSGLRGRGGAYFPVATKWETARNTTALRKFLIINAEEGEPGIYKDRHLLEGDPHRVIEGFLIAALAIGATDVVVFVNGEARLSQQRLSAALAQARAQDVVHVPVEIRLGAGGYVLGEETALINAIHGLRAEPLARPPFPAVSGLLASPTVINNVETLANLPDIVLHGGEWLRAVGSAANPGTKLVSLAGAVRQPGLYEVPLGTSLGAILDDYGAGATGPLSALLVGGPSGSILPTSALDTPFDVQPLQAIGGVLGAGGIVALRSDECPVHAVRELIAYNARESCGKCTPCREGTVRMRDLFEHLGPDSLPVIDELNDVLAFGSLCGLGQMAPNPVRALLRHFPADIEEHQHGRCAAGVCTSNGAA